MSLSRLLVVSLGVLLGACSTAPKHETAHQGKAGAKVDESAVSALYARLDVALKRYETGRELVGNGEVERGQKEIGGALDDLRGAAQQCHQSAGCEEDRFLSAFDGLLRRRDETVSVDANAAPVAPAAAVGEGDSATSPVIAALPEANRSVTLLKGRQLGDIIALNGPVKAAMEEWLTQYRPNLIDAYVNYQFMRYRMWPEYQRAELPEALLFGMLAKESGGRVHAVSRSGAAGPLQFMYTTGLRFGLSTVNGFDQRFDPQLAARANASYLNEQLRIFNNNLELVIAAYNGGEGRMVRLAGPNGSFWDPRVYSDLSPETRDYVPMVLAAAWLFMHPERYNLAFPKIDGKAGAITLKQPASINELAVCLGQEGGNPVGWFRALRNLNPSFDPQEKQAVGTRLEVPAVLEAAYSKMCASGQWADLAGELHAAVAPALAARAATRPATSSMAGNYTVRKGDTLAGIAHKLGCSNPRDIADLNSLRAPQYAIRAGQTLRLPSCGRN
jgi:membrane-bound lytic murein transglycosylase D